MFNKFGQRKKVSFRTKMNHSQITFSIRRTFVQLNNGFSLARSIHFAGTVMYTLCSACIFSYNSSYVTLFSFAIKVVLQWVIGTVVCEGNWV